jgi:tetratricopeptide (TPR) repeat protein
MRRRRVKLVWGASQVIRGRWYLGLIGFYERRPGVPDSGLAVSVRGLLMGAVALGLAVYLGTASVLFWVWQRNGFRELSYVDALLYPVRREAVSAVKGRAFLVRGRALFEAGRYLDAASLLRHGLARHPQDFAARRQLAQFYLLANQRPLASRVLEDGLGVEYPGRPYLEFCFELAEEGEDHDRIVAYCDRYSAAGMAAEQERRWLEGRKFAALLGGGHAGEALACAEAGTESQPVREQRVLALLALHRAADALHLLDEWGVRPGTDPAMILRLRVRALGEAGRIDEMERAVDQLHGLSPFEPNALAYGVVQFALAKRDDVAARALENYLFRFGGSAANIGLVAEPLAGVGNLPLLLRCLDAAVERGYPPGRLQSQVVQVHLQRGNWTAAAFLLEKSASAHDRNDRMVQAWREWAQRLIEAATAAGDSAQLPLIELLRSRSWPLRTLRQSVEAMLLAERWETAREITAVGMRSFPGSPWLHAMAETVRRQLEARQAAALPAFAQAQPAGEEMFFQNLQQLTGAGRWDEIERAIRGVRTARPAPDWLERRDAELWFVQIRSSQARGDRSALAAAARMNLLGGHNRAGGLLDLGREFSAAGDLPSAVLLAREILQRFPDYAPAKRQLAQWTPPASAVTEEPGK